VEHCCTGHTNIAKKNKEKITRTTKAEIVVFFMFSIALLHKCRVEIFESHLRDPRLAFDSHFST
jgi:hypothetical protein